MHLLQRCLLCLPALLNDSFYSLGFARIPIENRCMSRQQFSHACSTPLTSLLCDASLLVEQNDTKQAKHIALRMQAAAQRLRGLFAVERHTNIESFSIIEQIQIVQTFFSRDKSIFIDCKLPEKGDATIFGSPILFSEILICIIKNAVEAYPKATKLKRVSVKIAIQNNSITITVTDEGTGMHPIELWLAKKEGISFKERGSGIGLSFSIATVRTLFSGDVSIKSKRGKGTTVAIRLPTILV